MLIPSDILTSLPTAVREVFEKWQKYLQDNVEFNLVSSDIHTKDHCTRVLLYALMMGYQIFGDDKEALEALAHASIFHDTRRFDDYLDVGHGARAAVYYQEHCKETGLPCHKESVWAMRYHDIDDKIGLAEIEKQGGTCKSKLIYSIFKDADALDRFRLGRYGLNPKYLRTTQSKKLIGFAKHLVSRTMDPRELTEIETLVMEIMEKQKKENKKD